MSQWTHVSGCIRVDGLPFVGREREIEAVLGRPSGDYNAERYDAGENIPTGSEGTIQYKIIHAGEGLVWKTVAIWGDLRDFGAADCAEIDAWFAHIVASDLMLRAAHLLVEVEYGESYLLRANAHSVSRVSVSERSR